MVDNPWIIGNERLVEDNVAQKRGDRKKRLERKKAIKRAIEKHVTESRALLFLKDETEARTPPWRQLMSSKYPDYYN
jgi:hypothetical protein